MEKPLGENGGDEFFLRLLGELPTNAPFRDDNVEEVNDWHYKDPSLFALRSEGLAESAEKSLSFDH
jgi:hypothetical protein